MTQIASFSIGSNPTNSKAVWLSKLACRREVRFKLDDVEGKKVSSNDSIEISFPILEDGTFSHQRKYNNIPSFPMCLIGCNKTDDETSDLETLVAVDNLLSCTENDDTHDSNTLKRTINREVLSPTIQLLHEVYLKKWPSNSGVYFLRRSSKTNTLSQNELCFDPVLMKTRADDDNNIDDERNDGDSIQKKERMIFRQQLRYEAIRKELFDDVSNATIDKNSRRGNFNTSLRCQDRNDETDSLIDAAGCQGASFWKYIPNMSNLLVNVMPENEVIDDDSQDDRDFDDRSYSAGTNDGQSLFSSGTETNNDSVKEEDDYTIPDVAETHESNFENENHEDSSHSSSLMDQSPIFLTMTSASKHKSSWKTQQQPYRASNSIVRNAIDAKKISELTLDDFTVNSRMQTDYFEDEFKANQNEDKYDFHGFRVANVGWARYLQPLGNHQKNVDMRQCQWLNAIHESFKDHHGLLLNSLSDQQLERRLAAKEALQRMVQQHEQQHRFNPLSTMTFDFWA